MVQFNSSGLFSIDVDAHLKKAAAYTFGSPSHFPVEMARAGLRRGARRIDAYIHNRYVRVIDDGAGLNPFWLNILGHLLDPAASPAMKESAVERIQEADGYGILALFAASPHKIILETAAEPEKFTLHYDQGKFSAGKQSGVIRGTDITVFTCSRRHPERERKIFDLYCQGANRTIYLNERLISGKSLLSGQLATLNHSPAHVGVSLFKNGCIGIPAEGEICRVRLLDCGIPFKYMTMPPQHGFIFDAAIEYSGELTAAAVKELTGFARKLYEWLCLRFEQFPPSVRERIQELVFTHSRLTLEDDFLHMFSPFKIHGRQSYLSLSKVLEAAHEGIRAIPISGGRRRRLGGSHMILALTREQADFLVNRRNIPVTFLTSANGRRLSCRELYLHLHGRMRHLLKQFLATGLHRAVIPSELLNKEELFFLEQVKTLTPRYGHGIMEIRMVKGEGPFMAVFSRDKKKLLIRRGNRMTRKAIRLVQQDPRTIEMLAPLLFQT